MFRILFLVTYLSTVCLGDVTSGSVPNPPRPTQPRLSYMEEDQLRKMLFQNTEAPYNKATTPRLQEGPVEVRFGVQILKAEITFVDPRLTWQPEDYGNIEMIGVDSGEVWLPDIALYQETRYLGGDYMTIGKGDAQVLVFANGTVLYVPTHTIITPCQLDYSQWPMDNQVCKFRFGSWIHDNTDITLELFTLPESDIMKKLTVESQSWKLAETHMKKRTYNFPGIPNGYDAIEATVRLQRRSEKYCATFFAPLFAAIAISVLALLEKNGKPMKNMMFIFNIFFVVGLILFQYQTETISGKPRVFCFGYGLVLIQLAMIVGNHLLRCDLLRFVGHGAAGLAARVRGKRSQKPEHEPLADASIDEPPARKRCFMQMFLKGVMLGVHLAFLIGLYYTFWPMRVMEIDIEDFDDSLHA
ncbi:unnamed protein product [Cyprideis torosa]|uniref:Uncharacterized protein n=1 Tax=Cyprideis torosa TaxID=163714 RepID=A0A7R8W3G3_9CRUS|nr:unnamed protein product [Cyprideis torosa]CAG0882839.1 unnamed protein product [Cyprideis torosa]